jgi:hypothetical protein
MKIRKSFAGIAAGSLALAGVAVATAPTANASTVTGQLFRCNVLSSANPWTTNITSTAVANPVGVGVNSTVTTSVSAVQTNGPVPLPAAQLRAIYNISFDGGATQQVVTTTVTDVGGGAGNTAGDGTLGANESFSVPSGAIQVSSPTTGAKNFEIVSIVFDNTSGGADDFTNFPNGQTPGGVDTSCLAVASVSGGPGAYTWGAYTGDIVTETVNVVGPEVSVTGVTNTGADDLIGGGDDTALPGAVNGGRAYFRGLDALSIAGNNQWDPAYTAAGNIQLRVCADAAGTTGCSPYAAFPAPPGLTVNGSGQLSSGTVQVATGAFTGNQYLVISQHSVTGNPAFGPPNPANRSDTNLVKKASFPITILGTRTIVPAQTTVSPGSPVAATGSNFYPGESVSLGTDDIGDAGNSVVASTTGAFTGGSFTVLSGSAATQARANGVDGFASAAITLSSTSCTRQVGSGPLTTCETQQSITASVTPGALTQEANAFAAPGYAADLIPMGSVTTSIAPQVLTGQINPITVTDVRGGTATWSLTATMPDLAGSGTAAGAEIEASNLTLGGVSCAEQVGSATGITSGTGGAFGGTALTICDASTNNADSNGDTVGGQWIANAPLQLNVPAFQQAGGYSSIITFTLT